MKRVATFLLVLVLSCYIDIVESYGGRGYNPLAESLNVHLRRRMYVRSKTSPGDGQPGRGLAEHMRLMLSSREEDYRIYVGPQGGLKDIDKVASLPGQPSVNFNQYAGYITVDNQAGRALFYYFVESSKTSTFQPLVLWLNGGPGCSSIGTGAMQELGPFRVGTDGKTLKINKYAWNNKANILFLESPAGVGFSYSNTTSDYMKSGDNRTSQDSYTFLINWFERFPEYKNRDFYIAGESYAGHYVPQLAQRILTYNKKTDKSKIINLQGIVVGNGLIDENLNNRGINDFFYSHAMITADMKDKINIKCNDSLPHFNEETCIELRRRFERSIDGINIYDIYAPLCNSSAKTPPNEIFDPCTEDYIEKYLNMPEVQKALHANITALSYRWTDCSKKISYLWNDREWTILPIIRELMASGIRIWLYSGDTDGAVPVTSTEYSIGALNLTVKTDNYTWYNAPGEVGGFVVEYYNLTFVTVRGSGHFVPSFQPARALLLFSSFLEGKLPPRAL